MGVEKSRCPAPEDEVVISPGKTMNMTTSRLVDSSRKKPLRIDRDEVCLRMVPR
jgi:hypothetical protein